MKKHKLNLDQLQVKSFVIQTEGKKMITIIGGDNALTTDQPIRTENAPCRTDVGPNCPATAHPQCTVGTGANCTGPGGTTGPSDETFEVVCIG